MPASSAMRRPDRARGAAQFPRVRGGDLRRLALVGRVAGERQSRRDGRGRASSSFDVFRIAPAMAITGLPAASAASSASTAATLSSPAPLTRIQRLSPNIEMRGGLVGQPRGIALQRPRRQGRSARPPRPSRAPAAARGRGCPPRRGRRAETGAHRRDGAHRARVRSAALAFICRRRRPRCASSAMRVTIWSATISGKALERGLLGGDRRIFASDDVDAGVRSGGGVEHDRAGGGVDQLIARAQGAPLARHRVVARGRRSR